MNPELNRGQSSLEVNSPSADHYFNSPEIAKSPELDTSTDYETHGERPTGIEAAPREPIVSVVPQLVITPVDQGVEVSSAANASSSLVASDEDVIETEWVKIAKQVISQTQDDPSARERALTELQKDYLMKRYGKVLGE